MKENAEKFITTTLPYVNSKPHIGHTFEFVLADIIARFHRDSKEVFFNVGIDEHGIKVQQAAEKAALPPQEYCDILANIWKDFCSKFQISYDNFYRTSSTKHKEKVLKFFELINNPEYIYQKEYVGHYCVGCETYITEKEIVDGKCPIHKTELTETKELNWFFNLAKFRDNIKDSLVDKKLSTELKNIAEGFDEISISRQNVDWGIKFDDKNTFYVWFEALLNYPFAAGFLGSTDERENFQNLWSESLIICGPDNLKFQAYILPAILAAAEISQPKEVLVHGNILDATGTKMSKTLGNVVDPIEQLERWGVSPVRFYLFAGLNIFDSSSYSEEALYKLWNSEIVNNFGNLLSRLFHLIDIKAVDVFDKQYAYLVPVLQNTVDTLNDLFEQSKFAEFKDSLSKRVSDLNKRINDEKPYAKDSTDYAQVLSEIYHEALVYSKYYSFIIPEYKDILAKAFVDRKKISIFPKIDVDTSPVTIYPGKYLAHE